MVQRHDLPPAGLTGAADPAADPPRPGADGATDRAAEATAAPSGAAGVSKAAAASGTPSGAPAWEAATAGEVLSAYLHAQAGDFLRSLRMHRESGSDVQEAAEAARLLRRAARRISGALYVYRPLTDTAWSDELRTELAWLSGTLAREHAYAERLDRLRGALHRLSGAGGPSDRSPQGEGTAAETASPGERPSDTQPVNAAHATSAARTARGAVTVAVDGAGGPSGTAGPIPRSTRASRRSVSLAAGAPGGGAADPPVGGQGARPGPADAGGGAEGATGTTRDRDRDRDRDESRAAGRRRGERGDKSGRGAKGEKGERSGQPGATHQRAGAEEEARGGALTVGAARAGALLERQLTLARTRAHTAALEALGSSRFHAVADTVALLASDVPLDEANAARPAGQVLLPLAELANRRLAEAVEALPLVRAGHPYNAEALVHGLAATPAADAPPASERQDAPWHHVRHLLRLRRYALEVLDQAWQQPDEASGPKGSGPGGSGPGGSGPVDAEPPLSVRLLAAGQALERHRDAAEAAAAAAAAARTPRIAPATAYALGVLHADQRHEVEAARFAFGRIWRRVSAARAS
ncbi:MULTISPECIES: CHAD domain-containing protein [Streptomyces violaceusniger group]|uniref:CHAD domain-containing protein n=1 Tax=Streptomyces violaceusniger group TaxID=2839105 RepID=UPI0027DF0A55|nr:MULTISPECIES: CHAD domain-containing protein [Streptomyces violaceusniger group]